MYDYLAAEYIPAPAFSAAVTAILVADGHPEYDQYAHCIRLVPGGDDGDFTYYAVDDSAALDYGYIRVSRVGGGAVRFEYTIPPWIKR